MDRDTPSLAIVENRSGTSEAMAYLFALFLQTSDDAALVAVLLMRRESGGAHAVQILT